MPGRDGLILEVKSNSDARVNIDSRGREYLQARNELAEGNAFGEL